MRMIIFALLLAISYAQTELYKSEGNYNKASATDASAACGAIGMQLCTAGQLFNAVFNEGWGDLCYSGWLADDYKGDNSGWFNANGNCGDVGFNGWNPSAPGSHCCDASLPAVTPTSCAEFDAQTCLAQGDKIMVDDAGSTWCTSGTCDIATCCQEFVAAPEYITLPEGFPKYVYADADEAHAACQAKHPDLVLCTKDQVRDLADSNSICASGWWVTEKDATNAITGTDRGWYVGENFASSCGGTAGERSWKPADGNGAAHCCVPSYIKSGYRTIGDFGSYSRETGEVYCAAQGYSYSLCSKDQLQTVSMIEMPNICMSGYLSDDEGWWQGNVVAGSCGAKNTFNTWKHPSAPGAHCCLSYVQAPPITPIEDYGIMPESGNYGQSTMSSGAVAEQACIDRGYDQLCTMGQQAYVAENPSEFEVNVCKVGWVKDGDNYDSGYWGTCSGGNGGWNNAWQPAGNPVAHCCFSDVPAVSMVQYPYYNGGWSSVGTLAAAEAACTGDYSVCSKAQLEVLATDGVTYPEGDEGVFQIETNICKQGWTSEGEKGWYQGEAGVCGATGWRSFNGAATYHCCLPFEADVTPTEPPLPAAFIQTPASGYPYQNADEAFAACQAVNSEYSLCADYEIIQMALDGVQGNDQWEGVERIPNMCYTAYTDPDRSADDRQWGWYVSPEGTCGGGEGWKKWRSGGVMAGAYCCYSPLFDAPATTTSVEETTTTMDPTSSPTTTTTTEQPTIATTVATTTYDPSETLPSSRSQPDGCTDTGFTIQGFPSINFCSSNGVVYLNGRSTCVPSGGDQNEMYNALQTVWDDQWYLATDGCTADKTYDEATSDQLWITNEMCNNLEEDISNLESSTSDYMSTWTQAVIDLVNAQKSNFNSDTQQALDEYLATLQNNP